MRVHYFLEAQAYHGKGIVGAIFWNEDKWALTGLPPKIPSKLMLTPRRPSAQTMRIAGEAQIDTEVNWSIEWFECRGEAR